ncbi:H-hydrate dehydratase [Cucurbitaria berberidis CBS 394.84]|uniref:ATP-dependent (S)-NAD(P)H-hydrate dehydratase n=1 Tax=Cucurbitaria berberidis CBS 394.84 TaxID=1168544 RepID=A0A9P4G7T5_9PLEO|nr:H-hydrate dehydratase [Cucurbitaria berberidis CBS 394.84]KAF1840506.1 H-hydrate dehydratase [Cucurbitaria berberidis CBS 394.84]
MAAASRKDLLKKVYNIVPPMLESFHKGQLGRVAVIGGSEDYTGAPYFSAMASAKLGCDMSHVICEPGAGAVIKTYSPNLMVHPYMRQSKNLTQSESADTVSSEVIGMLSRLHVIVIGPGLGRDKLMQDTCAKVIEEARKQGIPFVLDADGLYLAQTRPELVDGYKECILTPNVVEFGRLAKTKGINVDEGDPSELCSKLSKAFGGVTIIQKGAKDYISNGTITLVSDGEGGLKRSGGQGDTLTGSLATLLAYRTAYHDKIWDHGTDMDRSETLALAAFGGSCITRECSKLAYKEKGRSLQASDLTEHVHTAFLNVIGEKDETPKL